jgi:putative Mg2+ transporter-C (MgtC) family protein
VDLLLQISWDEVVWNLGRLLAAFILALPMGWDRESRGRTAGLRTFPLVSVATCGYMLIGIQVLSDTNAESRAMYGIITGMGFIGGGAILQSKDRVRGTATAASLWNTGAIGLAVAWNRIEIALLLMLLNVLTLRFLSRLKSSEQDDT